MVLMCRRHWASFCRCRLFWVSRSGDRTGLFSRGFWVCWAEEEAGSEMLVCASCRGGGGAVCDRFLLSISSSSAQLKLLGSWALSAFLPLHLTQLWIRQLPSCRRGSAAIAGGSPPVLLTSSEGRAGSPVPGSWPYEGRRGGAGSWAVAIVPSAMQQFVEVGSDYTGSHDGSGLPQVGPPKP